MLIQLARKRKKVLTDKNKRVKTGANSSDIAFFFFWFNIINFCFFKNSVYKNYSRANTNEANKLDIGIITKEPNLNTVDAKKQMEQTNQAQT